MKTINLTPYHIEQKPDGDGFMLEVWCCTDGGNEIKVKLHFHFWWIGYIARQLWKAIEYRQTEIDTAKQNMTAQG